MAKNKFWRFKPCDKYDEIVEGRHDHLYYAALSDSETGIEQVSRSTYILYGDDQALLMTPKNVIYRFGLDIIEAFIGLKKT